MTDIVERLRIRQPLLGTLCDEAADEIERLRKVLTIEGLSCKVIADIERQQAEIERLQVHSSVLMREVLRLRAALREIAEGEKYAFEAQKIARRALEPKP